MREILQASEPLLLFVVIGVGYLLGQVRIARFSLGISAVLFVGIGLGAWVPAGEEPLRLSPALREVGLILFVYAVGLTSGSGFFSALKRNGVRYNAAVVGGLSVGAVVAFALGRYFALTPPLVSGAFCGGLTSTPALAAATQLLKSQGSADAVLPALGYSVTYPFGVLGGLLAFQLFTRIERKAFRREVEEASSEAVKRKEPASRSFVVTVASIIGHPIGELAVREKSGLVISRIKRDGEIFVPTKYTVLQEGDIVVAVGSQQDLARAADYFGAESTENIEFDRARIDARRILVSKKTLVGRRIEDLDLERRFNAQITRMRRADIDFVPSADMRVELGDRLRVVAPRERMAELSAFFGDSERDRADIDYTAFTLGISLGVLIGMVPIPVPGFGTVSLGLAGGPLLVALVLGKLGRTGNMVWMLPLEANMVIRNIGILLFFAVVGVGAGSGLVGALRSYGVGLLIAGAAVTAITTGVTLFLLRVLGGANVTQTLGATSGMQTQPATLASARDLSRSDEVYIAYATTYPVGMIGKIVIAQLLLMV